MIGENLWLIVISTAVGSITTVFIQKFPVVLSAFRGGFRWLFRKSRALYTRLVVKWRERKSKEIAARNLSQASFIRIPKDQYNRSLGQPPGTTSQSLFPIVKIDYPRWLNDYYIAKGMEELFRKRRIVKAVQYDRRSWPAREMEYIFRHVEKISGASVEDEINRVETDSMCLAYQQIFDFPEYEEKPCPIGNRFEAKPYARTLSYTTSTHGTTWHLKESAPPCERCWERGSREEPLRRLVAKFLENELYREAISLSLLPKDSDECSDNRGNHERFVESVVSFCIESGIGHEDVDVALNATTRAVAIYDRYREGQSVRDFNAGVLMGELVGLDATETS